MAKRNGSFPISVQPGIPKLCPTPEGWSRAPLKDFLNEIKRPVEMNDGHEYKLVTVKRSRGGAEERSVMFGRDIMVKSQFYVKTNDFLISKRQIVHGACALIPKNLDGAIVSNEYSVLGANDKFDLNFLKYLSHSIHFQQTCFHSSIGVHVEKMIFKLETWLKWDFNIPPLPEQKKIARILSTWDKAIEKVDKLIENSQQQKKALMQQLLTGKKRLPGFSGEWKEVSLKDIAEICVSNVDKKSVEGQTPVKLCNYTDVYYNNYISDSLEFMKATAKDSEIKKFSLKKDDVVITKDSETPGDIAIPSLVDEDIEGLVCGYHLAIIRSRPDVAFGEFLAHLFSMQKTRYYFFTLANGATRFGLNISSIQNARFIVPDVDEQIAIAKRLRLMNDTISNYKEHRDKLCLQKQALMQQLLTGKRRVKGELYE